MKTVELLAPARDLAVAIAAIDNGADAVYIGAPAFGARRAAANSVADIARLVEYAHRYYCRAFITLNTILYDNELPEAERLIRELARIGVDAFIVQDMGILRLDLPPVCLHASTQMHNYDLERIRFLDRLGFSRIVLARELTLDQIRTIRREVKAELEVFVHGALCVSLSGQCYLSQRLFRRSANRGECAQPCRQKWTVRDAGGRLLVDNRHILSLKDLNLSSRLADLVDTGVDSLKIEGRLKDAAYVANVTRYYSSLLEALPSVRRPSSGSVTAAFTPEPERSFNRGSSTYFIDGRQPGLANPDTPKSLGKPIGKVLQTRGTRLRVQALAPIANGDGLCWLQNGELHGIRINTADGEWLTCNEPVTIAPGTPLYRNYDSCFNRLLEREKSRRTITIRITATPENGHLRLDAEDEDGNHATLLSPETFALADNPAQRQRLEQQLARTGDTIFRCTEARVTGEPVLFIPSAAANALRRTLLDALTAERETRRPLLPPTIEDRTVPYPLPADWRLNIANRLAAGFYHDHGVTSPQPAYECTSSLPNAPHMRTRYCILHELGLCLRHHPGLRLPLTISDGKNTFRLAFDCKECFMTILDKP